MVSTRLAYGEALLELAREGLDLVAVAADTSKSMCTSVLEKEFPERSIEVGICEQNLMMVAAGLAAAGKTVFASTYAVFSSMRACEQVRTFIAYPGLEVKIVSGLGGLSAGIEGVTHLAVEDLAIMRAIPNLTILAPSDATATKQAIHAIARRPGPAYVRLGRDATPVVHGPDYKLEVGKAISLRRLGADFGLVATGLIVPDAIAGLELLAAEGIRGTLLEMHTLKPLDEEALVCLARSVPLVVTAEEHTVVGGLGGAVAECLSERCPRRLLRIGTPDRFLESGAPDELKRKYGLTASQMAERIAREVAVDRLAGAVPDGARR